jgi:flavin reductase
MAAIGAMDRNTDADGRPERGSGRDATPRRRQFLDAMALTAASVSVVTTDGPAGRDGVAVSAMSPVSADAPDPLLLVCLHHLGRVVDKVLANGVFCVNVLGDGHAAIADRFAGRADVARHAWFADLVWDRLDTGSPACRQAIACFDCTVAGHHLVETHHVIFGAVRSIRLDPEGRPLVHARRGFHRLGPPGTGSKRWSDR